MEEEREVVLGAAGPPVGVWVWEKGRGVVSALGRRRSEARQESKEREGTCCLHGPSQAASTTLIRKRAL